MYIQGTILCRENILNMRLYMKIIWKHDHLTGGRCLLTQVGTCVRSKVSLKVDGFALYLVDLGASAENLEISI